MHQQQTVFENIVGNGEIACNEQFLLFPQWFLFSQIIVSLFIHYSDILSLFAAELEEPKIGILGEGLTDLREKNLGKKGKTQVILSKGLFFRVIKRQGCMVMCSEDMELQYK